MIEKISESTLVATLGGQPQVVTFTLDVLLAQGEMVREVVVLHLAATNPRYGRSLARVAAWFPNDRYEGRPIRFRPVLVRRGPERLADIRNEVEAEAAWNAIYELIAGLKRQGRRLHLCIAGGRRLLGLLAMSAALLHFGHRDRLWHLYTPGELLERARDGAIMHARPEDGVRLIPIPLVPWGAYFPALRALAQTTPEQAIAVQTRWLNQAERVCCRAVVERLTPRRLDVLRAFAAGQRPQEVAESLCITLKTVDSHKTVVLDECRNAWGVPEDTQLDYHFLREKFWLFFAETI